jgi:hypothetical protein
MMPRNLSQMDISSEKSLFQSQASSSQQSPAHGQLMYSSSSTLKNDLDKSLAAYCPQSHSAMSLEQQKPKTRPPIINTAIASSQAYSSFSCATFNNFMSLSPNSYQFSFNSQAHAGLLPVLSPTTMFNDFFRPSQDVSPA